MTTPEARAAMSDGQTPESWGEAFEADLRDAYMSGAKLVGYRPIVQIGPIGSRADWLVAYLTDGGVMLRAGCFFGTVEEFEKQCAETHGNNEHAREYKAALAMVKAHAEIWTPATGATL